MNTILGITEAYCSWSNYAKLHPMSKILSVHITVTDPSISALANLLISACFFAILLTPIARVMVATAGKPSGTGAIASTIPLRIMFPMLNP